ncbi:MAG: ABC transporter permease [Bryobacteraceae bacterium]
MPEQTPWIAERLLRRLVPGREGETIAGDLREEFEARGGGRLWYWAEVLSCVAIRLSPHRLTAPGLRQDLHYAVRVLRRNPGYTCTAVVCLALGIGVNSTVFTMVDELFWQPLPVPQSDRVMAIGRAGEGTACSYRDYLEFERRLAAPGGRFFSGILAYDGTAISLDVDGMSQIVMAEAVSANFARVLKLPAQAGRWFTPEDDRPGADPVAVLSDGAWTRRFGRSMSAIGRRVRIETQWYRIVGVAPRGFLGVSPPHTMEIWVPFTSQPYVTELLANSGERERPRVSLIGRLAAGARVGAAEAALRSADSQIRREFPRDNAPSGALTLAIAAGASMPAVREVAAPISIMLLSVTGIVLLIACVNVANLLLSRSAMRRREMAVRQALGASRWRLARQTLAEGIVLAAGGAALGLLFGFGTNRLLAHSLPALPHVGMVTLNLNVNWRVAAFVVAAALASAVLFTISPAIEHSRPGLTASLKDEGAGARRMRQRDAYVVAQVALSLALLIAATLLLRALQHAQGIDPGFAMDHRLAARIYLSEPEFSPESGKLFLARLLGTVRAAPGVRSATLSYTTPLSFTDRVCTSATPNGRPRSAASDVVVPGYFDTMGIPILRGRQFEPADQPGSPPVAIVNQTFARRYWPNEDPIGKTLWLGCKATGPRTLAEVIGVARDAKYESLDEAPRPFVHRPLAQNWEGFLALTVETSGSPGEFTAPLRGLLRRTDSNLRVYEIQTLEEFASQSLWKVRWQASLLAVFGGLAMLLAAVGLYGVVAYSVAQRTREIGVRIAMGAQRADVLWMVLARGLGLTAAGIGLGLALSAAVMRLLAMLLYGLSPLDPVAFAVASLGWMATAMLASYVPARRAMRVDPVVALRWE